MGKDHLGRPSGSNKSEGTGLSPSKNEKQNSKMASKYMKDENSTADNANERHHNRNIGKTKPTRAGGYK